MLAANESICVLSFTTSISRQMANRDGLLWRETGEEAASSTRISGVPVCLSSCTVRREDEQVGEITWRSKLCGTIEAIRYICMRSFYHVHMFIDV